MNTNQDFEFSLTLSQIDWEIICHPENIPIEGNALASGDDEEDEKEYRRIYRELDSGNQWAWCCVEMKGTFKGLSASDFLGGYSCDSEEDFKTGGYFEDMQQIVLSELQGKIETVLKAIQPPTE